MSPSLPSPMRLLRFCPGRSLLRTSLISRDHQGWSCSLSSPFSPLSSLSCPLMSLYRIQPSWYRFLLHPSRMLPSLQIPYMGNPPTHPVEVPPSHHMVTWAKVDIFKSRYPIDLASMALLSALTVISEPRGFKSTAKHPEWLSAM